MKLKYLLISTLAVAISACAPSPKTEDNKPEESETPAEDPGEDPGEKPGEDPGDTPGDDPGDTPGEDPSVIRYVKVTEALDDWAGEYVITAETSEGIFVMGEWGDDSYGTSYAVPVGGPENKKDFRADLSEDGTFPAEIMDPYKVTLLHQDSFYTIFFSGFGYLGVEEDANQLWKSSTATGDAYLWDPDFDEGEMCLWNVGQYSRCIEYNASRPRFAAYEYSQESITLYRRSESSGTVIGPGEEEEKELSVEITTGEASPRTAYMATLNGSFLNANASIREAGFEWGTTEDLGNTLQASYVAASFKENLMDLTPSTVYWYRAYVVLQDGDNIKYFYGNTRSFETLAPEAPPSGVPQWTELPVMHLDRDRDYLVNAHDRTQYYSWHYTDLDGPGGGKARNYTACYSATYHCPLWIAAPRHSMYAQKSVDRTDAYKQDPKMPSDIQYKSKSTGGGCNKGHMLGSAERLASRLTNEQVFYYSNIAPQLSSGFNTGGGGWNTVEDWGDDQVCQDTLFEVIGTYFEKYESKGWGYTVEPATISFGGRDDVVRPTMFYYVLLRTKDGNTGKVISSCSADELQCVAVVRPHTNDLKSAIDKLKGAGKYSTGKRYVYEEDLMSVSELEQLTGLTFFPNVPNAPKAAYDPSDWNVTASNK